jgi:hypothetical protein
VYRARSAQAGRILTVMEMVPDLQRALRADHLYGFRCTGTFARPPVCLPDQRGGAAAPGVGGMVPPRGFAPGGGA